MSRIIIKNSKIVNENTIIESDIAIKNDRIDEISHSITANHKDKVIDAKGLYLLPGMIDDQVHFREPGMPNKGKFITESAAAVAGGITSVMDMPNTSPLTINEKAIIEKHQLIAGNSHCNYAFYLGATNDNIDDIKSINTDLICGVKVFMGASTGNMLVDNEETLDKIFKHSQLLIATHCESTPIITENEKIARDKYGEDVPINLHGIIRSREACIASTNLAMSLAQKHQAQLHVLHISTAEEVALFKQLPLNQKSITAEACVHFTWFDDSDYEKLGALIKCNPAIKQQSDRLAIIDGINFGHLDVIATDHAPHTWDEKSNKYFKAPSGLPLVQTALSSLLTLVNERKFTIEKIVEKTSHQVAQLFNIKDRGYIREGYYADLVLVDMDKTHTIHNKDMLYQCKWTPYDKQNFSAKIKKTWVNGELKWSKGKLIGESKGRALQFDR